MANMVHMTNIVADCTGELAPSFCFCQDLGPELCDMHHCDADEHVPALTLWRVEMLLLERRQM